MNEEQYHDTGNMYLVGCDEGSKLDQRSHFQLFWGTNGVLMSRNARMRKLSDTGS